MPAGGAFLVVVLLLAVAAPLVLYALVRAEHDRREEMDREDAERYARRDTPDDAKRRDTPGDAERRDGRDSHGWE